MRECVVEHIKGAGTPHSPAPPRLLPGSPRLLWLLPGKKLRKKSA